MEKTPWWKIVGFNRGRYWSKNLRCSSMEVGADGFIQDRVSIIQEDLYRFCFPCRICTAVEASEFSLLSMATTYIVWRASMGNWSAM